MDVNKYSSGVRFNDFCSTVSATLLLAALMGLGRINLRIIKQPSTHAAKRERHVEPKSQSLT